MKFKLTESIDWDKVQWGVHQFSTESIIFRGTEEECQKYIDERPELWDDAEVYFMTPDDPHYLKEAYEDKIELEYDNLKFTQTGNQRDADDWDEWDREADWTLEVDKDDLYAFIMEECITEEDYPRAFEDDFSTNNEADMEAFNNWLDDNFDEIFDKYKDKIMDNYEAAAVKDAELNYDPDDEIDWDSMPGGHDDYDIDESINKGEDMKFKLTEAAESKICCICKKPFDGHGNNAEPICSGSCCDECNMKEVIPARISNLKKSKIDESLSEREITTILSDARDNSDDSEPFEYWIGFSAAAYSVKESDLFLLLADHINETDKEYQDMLRGYNDNHGSVDIVDESLNEGNSVSGKVPPALDSFLQDIAQMFGTIDYGDIMNHDYTADDIRKLNNLRRRFITWAQYNEDDEEVKAKFDEIANKVAVILKARNESKELNELNEEVEEVITEKLSDGTYKITYYLSTATRERRPETREDIDNDYKEITINADNDFDALSRAFMIQRGIDDSDLTFELNDYNINTEDDFVRYFDDRDWGDGSILMLKVEGPNGVLYDTGYNKQTFIDEFEDNIAQDDAMLADMEKEDPEMAKRFRDILGIDTTVEVEDSEDTTTENESLDDDYNFDNMDEMLEENTEIQRLRHMYGVED